MSEFDPTAWARYAADLVLANHDDAAVISTANYVECGVMIVAMRLVLENDEFARLVGERMERPRSTNSAASMAHGE